MRRTLSTFILCSAALAAGSAPLAGQTIGFKVGAAFANMSSDDGGTASGITGFSGGGHMRFGLGGRVGLQLELLSVTKGADWRGLANDVNYRFEYVEIPLLVHVPLTTGMAFAPYVFGGGSAGIEVKCRVTQVTGSSLGTERDCDDVGVGGFDRRSPDLSLIGGGGLAFAMGPGAVIIEGRYTAGMRSIASSSGIDLRHRTASLMAGYELPLGRTW
jgi:hypothetical protein